MIYPANFEDKVGFNAIRQHIGRYILSDLGRRHLEEMHFFTDEKILLKKLNELNELTTLLRNGVAFPAQDYLDPTSELIRIKTPGTAIELEALIELKISLNTISGIFTFLENHDAAKIMHLKELGSGLYFEPAVLKEINRIVDEKGNVRDNASATLRELRTKLAHKHREVDSRMAQIFAKVKKEGLAVERLEIAIRNGRQVIPVPVAFKRKIKGFIHDESATGQTVFIEPAEIFEINNEIREIENAEKREIIKILTSLADFLRPQIDNLLKCFSVLGEFDFLRAKAKFAIEINSHLPFISKDPIIDWKNAVHPLLYLAHKDQNKSVVPLNLSLNQDQRILLVSGPNAGGKSVVLKTTGLLQYMLQCGMLIPVDENSRAGIFRQIFIDIGDEQSLEQDLSTYTSHLQNLKHFLSFADPITLILIDEFGAGTEPQLGGAIAEAVLEKLSLIKCIGVITTHYANLKEAAGRIEGIVNGAMLFDPQTLSPMFVLQTGKPGSSFAFEIAEKIGFPKEVLKIAATKINPAAIDYDKLLQELELEKSALIEKKAGMDVADAFLHEMIEKYTQLSESAKQERTKILKQAKEEASRIIEKSNKLIENTIREIKQNQADKLKVKQLRDEIKLHQKQLEASAENSDINESVKEPESEDQEPVLTKGSWVRLKNQNVTGKIVDVRDHDIIIETGQMILHVQPDKLVAAKEPSKGSQSEIHSSFRRQSVYHEIHDRSANFKLSIDIRGKKAEEAVEIIRKHVDDAVFLGIPEITIIHGKGDGILRQVVRDFLKGVKEIKNLSEGHPDRGGAGLTIVSFKM